MPLTTIPCIGPGCVQCAKLAATGMPQVSPTSTHYVMEAPPASAPIVKPAKVLPHSEAPYPGLYKLSVCGAAAMGKKCVFCTYYGLSEYTPQHPGYKCVEIPKGGSFIDSIFLDPVPVKPKPKFKPKFAPRPLP